MNLIAKYFLHLNLIFKLTVEIKFTWAKQQQHFKVLIINNLQCKLQFNFTTET